MNGAESLVKTLLASGVDVCFANPGTSEMHWTAPIEWSGLNVSAWWASGPSGRWFPALGDGIPRRCAA